MLQPIIGGIAVMWLEESVSNKVVTAISCGLI